MALIGNYLLLFIKVEKDDYRLKTFAQTEKTTTKQQLASTQIFNFICHFGALLWTVNTQNSSLR